MPAFDLTFSFPDVPAEGTATELRPGLFWVRMPLPFALNHINLWLLRDGDGFTVIDAGLAGNRTKAAWERIFATLLLDRPVTRVLVTHFHPDHIGLAAWIAARFDAPLWMTRTEWLFARLLSQDNSPELEAATTRFYREAGLPDTDREALRIRGNAYPRGVEGVPAVYTRLLPGSRVEIGGRTFQIIGGGGHSPEHACLWCPEEDLFIAGDQVLPKITPNISVWPAEPAADPLAEFVDTLEHLRVLPDTALVLPSHGLPFVGLQRRIDSLLAHHGDRLAETLALCDRSPASIADLTGLLFRRPLDAHQLSFAAGEAAAHLNHLAAGGRLDRRVDADGVARFRRMD